VHSGKMHTGSKIAIINTFSLYIISRDNAMDIGALLSDSLTYAQEALVGKWARWAIFILFALPVSLIRFIFDPKTIVSGTRINWGAIPWGQIAILAGIGFILSFFISGYIVRIYRGGKTGPRLHRLDRPFCRWC
jgi:hypothetical protein